MATASTDVKPYVYAFLSLQLNCFIAVAFGCIERILRTSESRRSEKVNRMISRLKSAHSLLNKVGFESVAFGDQLAVVRSIIENSVKPDHNGKSLDSRILLEIFQKPEGMQIRPLEIHIITNLAFEIVSNLIVYYFRMLTSAQIRANPDDYEPFLLDYQINLNEFCENCIENPGAEAGEYTQICLQNY